MKESDVKTYQLIGGEVSDGFHTMSELYDHRRALTAALFKAWHAMGATVFKAKQHADDSMFPGYFIVVAITAVGQISYHYNLEHWDQFDIPERDRSPEWDGHSPADVVTRLLACASS